MIREPQDWLIGFSGEVRAMVPPHVAEVLMRSGVVRALRERFPHDGELQNVLIAIDAASRPQSRPGALMGTQLLARGEQPASSSSMTTAQAAAELGVTLRGVRQAVQRGRLKATLTNRRYTFDPAEVHRYRAQRAQSK